MKRWALLLAAALLTLAVAAAASAGAETRVFRIVPETSQRALPSAEVPNAPGAVALPPSMLFRRESQGLPFSTLSALWSQAGAAYGIPWEVLAAINKIESNFGRNMGPSSAGAIGWMQFMPSTWERWGTDATGDGCGRPLERRGCHLLRRAVSRRRRWPGRPLPRRLCVQPRALVRQRRARPGPDVRQRVGDRALARPGTGGRRAGQEATLPRRTGSSSPLCAASARSLGRPLSRRPVSARRNCSPRGSRSTRAPTRPTRGTSQRCGRSGPCASASVEAEAGA